MNGWRSWILGIVATLIVALVTNGILFQRETREQLATLNERIKYIETRGRETLLREFGGLEKRIEKLEQK